MITPSVLGNKKQLPTNEANFSRKVTMIRHTVERSFGRRKSKWKILAMPIKHQFLTNTKFSDIYRILAATDNKFSEPLFKDQPIHELYIRKIKQSEKSGSQSNFATRVQNTTSGWSKQHENTILKSLPIFDELQVKEFSLGIFGFNASLKYINSSNNITFWKHEKLKNTIKITGITSRYSGKSKQRTVYLQFPNASSNNNDPLRNVNACCTCKAGLRTLGTCAHVLAILRYCALKMKNKSPDIISDNTKFENQVFESLTIITNKRKKNHNYKKSVKKRKICTNKINNTDTESELTTETATESESDYDTQTNTDTDSDQPNTNTQKNNNDNSKKYKNKNVYPLINPTNTVCHANSMINLLLQCETIHDIVNTYSQSKKTTHQKIINEIKNIKDKHVKSTKNLCDFLNLNTKKQQDARESFSMVLDIIDRANSEISQSQPNFKLKMQHKKNNNAWNNPYYVDKLHIPLDCKHRYLKSSIKKYFTSKHKIEGTKDTYSYKLIELPTFLFVSIDWRLVNEKMPHKIKQEIETLKQEKSKLNEQIDINNTANLIIKQGKTKRKQKIQSNVGLIMKLNKITKEISKLESTIYVSKMSDFCGYNEIIELKINNLHKKYKFVGNVCHRGVVECSSVCLLFFIFLFFFSLFCDFA